MEINYAIDITSPVNDILMIYGDHYQVQRYTNGLDKISMDMWELTDHDNGWIPDGTGTNLSEKSERIYYLEDELGSIIKVIGENGKTSAHYNYDEFGRPLPERKFDQNWPGPDNTFGYTGYQYDVSAGLYYAQARYYMPEIGRFISEDPWPGDITAPQTLNPYPYVVNNPLRYVDPLGLNHKDLGPGGAAAPANKPSAVDKTTSQVVRDNTGNNTKYSDCPPKKVDPKDLDKANPWKTWELELQYNIQQQIENQNNLSLGEINKIVEIEILKLQRKYKIAYEMSDLVEAQFNRTMYNTLRPLYELNGNEDTKNKLVKLLNDSLNVAVVTEGSSFKGTSSTTQQLQELANKANQAVSGQGTVPGTLKHTEFAKQVKGLNNSLLQPEITYKNGQIVPYGTKGGVRLDVVEYNANGTIKAVYDLKTGKAGLTNSRIQEILNHLPNNAPVYEIRPK
ncbi:RHS repeat-associated core domain-containing protein [Lutispora saccharofermentans]|uniref:RHS repeat-associated core domain-containing protein n=1 Tax=Lutispora saccharofermentans TaxID=3024236 RepID=A0ABT1NP06_9FIRM|nr:RHS repeat-associated core domain-containing protein [Lutispora saccharofermentans]MCQ1531828.1 RHS repeat-associated core domain-containing protein [Lutispora saccharofermentans]